MKAIHRITYAISLQKSTRVINNTHKALDINNPHTWWTQIPHNFPIRNQKYYTMEFIKTSKQAYKSTTELLQRRYTPMAEKNRNDRARNSPTSTSLGNPKETFFSETTNRLHPHFKNRLTKKKNCAIIISQSTFKEIQPLLERIFYNYYNCYENWHKTETL